jgi:hypothetical protein
MWNIRQWWNYGVRRNSIRLALSLIFVCPTLTQASASEFFNHFGKSPEIAATASAEALDGIILGFSAFRRAETEGVDSRKNTLLQAAEKLTAASKVMTEASLQFQTDPTSSTPLKFDRIPVNAKNDLEAWFTASNLGTPQTWGELYQTGTKATGDLATTYIELAKRDDNAVFRDFLNATYPYLNAGATASEILSSQ